MPNEAIDEKATADQFFIECYRSNESHLSSFTSFVTLNANNSQEIKP